MNSLIGTILALSLHAGSPPPPELARIIAGDALWAAGDRAAARSAWRAAAESPHPATAAMAEARLLTVSGNLGLAVHGPRMDAALVRCPVGNEWCQVARHDARYFTHRLGLGPAPRPLPAPTETHDSADLTAEVERRHQWAIRPPPEAPTWTLGLSPFGASGYGFGAAVVFRHPDLCLRGGQLTAMAGATLSADHQLAVVLDTPGQWGLHAEGQTRRTTLAPETGLPPSAQTWQAHDGALGPRVSRRAVQAWIGPRIWRDGVGPADRRLGPSASAAWTPRSTHTVALHGHSMFGASTVHGVTFDARISPTEGGMAARFTTTLTAADAGTPIWRIAGWGGGTVLRHGQYLQYQAPLLTAGVLEWRQHVGGPVQLVAFAEGGWTGGPSLGAGSGAVVALPPRPSASVRVDAAWGGQVGGGPGGWGISTGWGHAF